jgi:hypothetical protein
VLGCAEVGCTRSRCSAWGDAVLWAMAAVYPVVTLVNP